MLCKKDTHRWPKIILIKAKKYSKEQTILWRHFEKQTKVKKFVLIVGQPCFYHHSILQIMTIWWRNSIKDWNVSKVIIDWITKEQKEMGHILKHALTTKMITCKEWTNSVGKASSYTLEHCFCYPIWSSEKPPHSTAFTSLNLIFWVTGSTVKKNTKRCF